MFRRTAVVVVAVSFVPALVSAEQKKDEKKPAVVYKACPKNKVWDDAQKGCICAPGFNWDGPTRTCVAAGEKAPPPESKCVPGKQWSDAHNACVMACPPGKIANAKGDACVVAPKENVEKVEKAEPKEKVAPPPTASAKPKTPPAPAAANGSKTCPEGKEWKDAFGGCVPICPADQVLDFAGSACHPIRIVRRPR